jgi:hypothetical protein
VINAIRAHLAEFGIVAPVGRNGVDQLLDPPWWVNRGFSPLRSKSVALRVKRTWRVGLGAGSLANTQTTSQA